MNAHSPSFTNDEPDFLRSILDSMPQGVIGHDVHRRIFYFNRAAEKITGYRREDVVGRDCHEVFGQPFCGESCAFCEGPPTQWQIKSYVTEIRNRYGKKKILSTTVTGMTDARGRLQGVLSTFHELNPHREFNGNEDALQRWKLVGKHPRMLEIYEQIRLMAASDHPVHLFGETGTGKELVAQAIHSESRRRDGPFVPVNCGALPEGILESELFGHVKGAFTGAVRDKKGRFELAEGGTLFLDEVAELPPVTQVKLLRVLQEKTFERVGDERSLRCDVRIISATNKDLKREVERGNFRADLYYRLRVLPLTLPPLRERRSDIPVLAEHFLSQSAKMLSNRPRITRSALELLLTYDWPGNVRELQSAIHYALLKAPDGIIRPESLPPELSQYRRPRRGPRPKLTREDVEAALKETGGNKSKAARLLGVGRATLYRFLDTLKDVS